MHATKFLEKFVWDLMNQNCKDVTSCKNPNSNQSVGIEFVFILHIFFKVFNQVVPELFNSFERSQ